VSVPTRSATGPRDPRWWTSERRELARAWWNEERRAREALRRLAKPQGCFDKGWWTAKRRQEHAERMRRVRAGDTRAALAELDDVYRQVDAAKARMRRLDGL